MHKIATTTLTIANLRSLKYLLRSKNGGTTTTAIPVTESDTCASLDVYICSREASRTAWAMGKQCGSRNLAP